MECKTYRHERIQLLAYQKWEWAGRPEGRDLEFWLEAEQDVNMEIMHIWWWLGDKE